MIESCIGRAGRTGEDDPAPDDIFINEAGSGCRSYYLAKICGHDPPAGHAEIGC